MGLLAKVTEMSWANPGIDEDVQSYRYSDKPTARIGLTWFLAVVTSFFFLFVMAYTERMELGDWDPLQEPTLLWFNTGLLVLASIAMQTARNRSVAGQVPGFMLTLGGLAALGFIVGQVVAWQQLAATGYYRADNPAYAFFILLTAAHAVHLLGGLYVWARLLWRRRQGADTEVLGQTIGLCALYWHYLLLLWVVLFVLMLTT